MGRLEDEMDKNMKARFVDNPCRGIVVGRSDQGLIQLSWIMGRSDNSRNRVYVASNTTLRTEPADPSKVEDPSLIIYNAMGSFREHHHFVSNGDQTDSLKNYFEGTRIPENELSCPTIFFDVLEHRFCEPDAPTFTPRITGYQDSFEPNSAYISVLAPDAFAKEHWIDAAAKSGLTIDDFRKPGMKDSVARELFNQEISRLSELNHREFPTMRKTFQLPLKDGIGYCVTTYKEGDHKALNAFEGDPFVVPMIGNLEGIMKRFWDVLEPEWRVALGGKIISPYSSFIAPPINRYNKI